MRTRTIGLLLAVAAFSNAQPAISSVLNAASFNEMFAPGSWIMIRGTALADTEANAPGVPLPKNLGGASVTVDGRAAGLLYASSTQINALIPFEISQTAFRNVQVVVATAAGASSAYSIYLNRNAPALFTLNASGSGRTFVFDASTFQAVDTLTEGQVVVLYAAGLGQTVPEASSLAGATEASRVLDYVEVFVGDQKAEVLYAGLAPGFPGVYQLNVRVPTLWTDRVYLRQGGWVSNITEAGIPVHNNVTNVSGQISALSADLAAIDMSQFLETGGFSVEFETLPNARPFVVAAVADGGGVFYRFDPANGMYQAWAMTPVTTSGDFSFLWPQVVADFVTGCMALNGNRYPPSRIPMYWSSAVMLSGPAEVSFQADPTGVFEFYDRVQIGSRFGGGRGFAAFLQVPCGSRTSQTVTYKLYVDGKVIDSTQVTYKVVHP